MYPKYERELIQYESTPSGFCDIHTQVPSFYPPDTQHSVYSVEKDRQMYVFPPDGRVLPYWGVVMVLAVLYQGALVPLDTAFDLPDSSGSLGVDFSCTLIYMLDILISFNTGYYRKGQLITSHSAIAKRYLTTWFIPDVVSAFPYDWLLQEPLQSPTSSARAPSLVRLAKIGRLLRSLRLIRIAKVRGYIIRIQEKLVHTRLAIVFTAGYLLGIMLGVAHWVACGFFYVSQLVETPTNWVYATGLQDAPIHDQYIAAIYWAVTTLTTTGYGDIHPIHTYEKIYGAFIMVISAGSFSYCIGKIGASIASVDRDKREHKDLALAVSKFLNQAEVPDRIIDRTRQYLHYVSESKKRRKTLNLRLLGHFSEPLKHEMSDNIYHPVLIRIPMFQHFPRSFTSQLTRLIRLEIFATGDIIFRAGQSSSQVYFIEKGQVEMFHQQTGNRYTVLETGDYFGEIAFFMGTARCASAGCLEFCELLSLTRTAFMPLLTPSSQYEFNQLQALYRYKDYAGLGLSCYLCGQSSHLAGDCPVSRVNVNRVRILQNWLDCRNYHRSKLIDPTTTSPNFLRKERKIHRFPHYHKENTHRESGFESLQWRNRLKKWDLKKEETGRMTTESCLISQRSTGGGLKNEPDSPRLPSLSKFPSSPASFKRSVQVNFA